MANEQELHAKVLQLRNGMRELLGAALLGEDHETLSAIAKRVLDATDVPRDPPGDG